MLRQSWAPSLQLKLAVSLFVGTFLVYARGLGYPFINFDDPGYAFANPHVATGVSFENLGWACITGEMANWHPLTWLSLQLDATLFGGTSAAGYRFTNVLLHSANTVLVFLVFGALTDQRTVAHPSPPDSELLWRSAILAALFALHPLRVESVVWISERKDVLSGFFWLLTMAAYVRYVRDPDVRTYLPVMVALAAGLMSKPMLVTLPCVLLLLDYWPLGRMNGRPRVKTALKLFAEKIPLLALVLVSIVVTLQVQAAGGAVKDLDRFPLPVRVANAVVSVAMYVWQTVCPIGLAPFYPYVQYGWGDPQLLASIALLLFLTIVCVRNLASAPWLFVGWMWFVGTLVPVIGLVQVGAQSRADRYTYLPHLGLLFAVVWGVGELTARWPISWTRRRAAVGLVLAVSAALTWLQVGWWQNDVRLWTRTLQVTSERNPTAQLHLGMALESAQKFEQALPHLQAAVKLAPHRSKPHTQLSLCLIHLDREPDAIRELRAAIQISSEDHASREMLGILLAKAGDAAGTEAQFLAIQPDDPSTMHFIAGGHLYKNHFYAAARGQFEKSVRADPRQAEAHYQLGLSIVRGGQVADAEQPLRKAIELDPAHAEAHTLLGLVLMQAGRTAESLERCELSVMLEPNSATSLANLALVLSAAGEAERATQQYAEASRLDPQWTSAALKFAQEALARRQGGLAATENLFLPRCRLREACEAAGNQKPRPLLLLAMLYAADQQVGPALTLLTRARAAATGPDDQTVRDEIEAEIKRLESLPKARQAAPDMPPKS